MTQSVLVFWMPQDTFVEVAKANILLCEPINAQEINFVTDNWNVRKPAQFLKCFKACYITLVILEKQPLAVDLHSFWKFIYGLFKRPTQRCYLYRTWPSQIVIGSTALHLLERLSSKQVINQQVTRQNLNFNWISLDPVCTFISAEAEPLNHINSVCLFAVGNLFGASSLRDQLLITYSFTWQSFRYV